MRLTGQRPIPCLNKGEGEVPPLHSKDELWGNSVESLLDPDNDMAASSPVSEPESVTPASNPRKDDATPPKGEVVDCINLLLLLATLVLPVPPTSGEESLL